MSPVAISKVNSPLLPQHFEQVASAATSKRKKVVESSPSTTKTLAKEVYNSLWLDFSSGIPTIKKTLSELGRNFTGLVSFAVHVIFNPRTVRDEYRIYNGDYKLFEELLLKRVPIEEVEYTPLRGGLYITPFEQFNPDTNHCLGSGDSRLGMLLKDKSGSPFIVEHNGTKGKLYWVTKKDGRYDVMQELFGRLGPVGAPDRPRHQVARKLVDYEKYFFGEAVGKKREKNVQIILDNALNIEQLLRSGNEFNLREEWDKSIKETLFKSIVGDISPARMDFVVNSIDKGFMHLIRTRVLSPVPGITIFSGRNQSEEKIIKDLHLFGLDMMSERIQKLQQNGGEPQDLLDAFALGAVKLTSEGNRAPEEVTFEASKIFFEMIGAGYFNRSNSRSNFDYIALTNPDFRQELIKALDQFKSTNLPDMMKEALENENLIRPFHAAAWAALAYEPALLFISRNSRVVFRNPAREEEITELTNRELKKLIKNHNLAHPLFNIPQNIEAVFPLGAYCREGLKRNGLLLEDGSLNSKEVFNPAKFETLNKVGKWQFGTGIRGCVGETFSVETLKWEALCMAYLLKKFPSTRTVEEPKAVFNIFSGKTFTVKA